MIYLILNLILTAVLIWFSSFADMHSDEKKSKSLINFSLVACGVTILNSLAILLSLFNNYRLIVFIGKLILVLTAFLFVLLFKYTVKFPNFKKNIFLEILTYIIFVGIIYIVMYRLENIRSEERRVGKEW